MQDDTDGRQAVSGSEVQAAEADAHLRLSLAELSHLNAVDATLPQVLTRIAELAVAAIPGADGAGLTLIQDGRADTAAASTAFVHEIDTIQYGLREGPCIDAAAEGRTVLSGSLGSEPAWPRFGPQAARLGVHSSLSLPLRVGGAGVGSLNVYAHTTAAFDQHAVALGELFAVPAAVSVQTAGALADARRLAGQLQEAMSTRAVIDQAMGIVMSRTGGTAAEAFERLRSMSQSQNLKLAVIAVQIVDEATRRARARNSAR